MADRFNLQQLREHASGVVALNFIEGDIRRELAENVLALADVVEAARSEGVQYALDWMTDGRTKGDQVRSDIERFRDTLAVFEEPA